MTSCPQIPFNFPLHYVFDFVIDSKYSIHQLTPEFYNSWTILLDGGVSFIVLARITHQQHLNHMNNFCIA